MTAEALYMLQMQQLAAHLVAWLASNPAEAFATATGLAGAFVLARNGRWAAYGWLAFLASNAAWIWFAARHGHAGLLAQQLGFTCSSLLGVWRWLLRPRLARAELPQGRNSQHVLKAEGASPDATDRENCANASPVGGPMGAGQAAAAAPASVQASEPVPEFTHALKPSKPWPRTAGVTASPNDQQEQPR